MSVQIKNPQLVGAKLRAYQSKLQMNSTQKNYSRKFNRTLLPTPASYYSKEFPKLKIKSEWVKVHCPFHQDKNPSLSINMVEGYFRCFSCGAKGRDVLDFHQLKYNMTFVEAVGFFGAWEQ